MVFQVYYEDSTCHLVFLAWDRSKRSHPFRDILCSEGKYFPELAQRKDDCTGGPRDLPALSSTSTASAVTAEGPEQGLLGLHLLTAQPGWAGVVTAAQRFLQPQGPLRDKSLKSHLLLYTLFFCQGKQTTGLHRNTVPLKQGREHFMPQCISFEKDVMEAQWGPSCTNRRKSWDRIHSKRRITFCYCLMWMEGWADQRTALLPEGRRVTAKCHFAW